MKILVLGAQGLLGHIMCRVLATKSEIDLIGTVSSEDKKRVHLNLARRQNYSLIVSQDLTQLQAVERLLNNVNPDFIVNCLSLPRSEQNDLAKCLQIYSILPARLAFFADLSGARLLQISSDGVFSGLAGSYTEESVPDGEDVYGLTKLLGEVTGKNRLTLRTSMIGHSLEHDRGLLDWFLAQRGECFGFAKSFFSGLTTLEIAQVVRDYVIPDQSLSGLYHLCGSPISKYQLLKEIAAVYGHDIMIVRNEDSSTDRSLCGNSFNSHTGYCPPEWSDMLVTMRKDYLTNIQNV